MISRMVRVTDGSSLSTGLLSMPSMLLITLMAGTLRVLLLLVGKVPGQDEGGKVVVGREWSLVILAGG